MPWVSPGLIAGSGLKHYAHIFYASFLRISRPNRREWIETPGWPRFPGWPVSPGLIAGSGLKPLLLSGLNWGVRVSPGLIAGSGLKR